MYRTILLPLTLLALVSACGTDAEPRASSPTTSSSTTGDPGTTATPVAAGQPRLAMTYDGGVLVLDAKNGEVLVDIPLEGFNRLNPAGDDRHLLISGAGGFSALDLGSWTDEHGDHGHSFTTDAALTDITFAATEAGHVVVHDDTTTLFDDGTGEITAFDPSDLADGTPATQSFSTPEAHHGVAAVLHDGNLLHTVGDEDERAGIRLTTASGAELAASEECPGVHGEAFAGDVALFGCEDGVLLLDGRDVTKVASPDAYGRIGNQAGSEDSAYVLGDYKVDRDAELERPTRVSIVDTATATLRLVDLGTSYSFRSLGRTADGDGLVLGTDGALHVIDPVTAAVTSTMPVVAPWEEPVDWHQPRPTLLVMGTTAYVTEPATQQLHVVDLAAGTTTATHDLPRVPDELNGTPG
jgi:outer membrane protein assembly factor BamB